MNITNKDDNFVSELLKELMKDVCLKIEGNIDYERFGNTQKTHKKGVFDFGLTQVAKIINGGGVVLSPDSLAYTTPNIDSIGKHIKGFAYLYKLLSDNESRSLLVKLIAFRILGNEHVKLPLNNKGYWEKRDSVRSLIVSKEELPINFMDWKLSLFDLSSIGYPIQMYLIPMGVCTRFLIKSYDYHDIVKVEKGDIVIDAGGCWGDTALYFAKHAGDDGKVYTFEFIPDNLKIM